MSDSLQPLDYSPPGSSIHRILQARILEWVAIPFSRGIFSTQGSNLSLLHYSKILYHLSYRGNMNWFKIGKEYIKAVCCHLAYLTSMQSTSCKMLDWMNHKLKSRLPGEISTTSDMQMIGDTTLRQKAKRN